MVMTPAVTQSAVAQKEWRYARQQGVRVYPVLGVAAARARLQPAPELDAQGALLRPRQGVGDLRRLLLSAACREPRAVHGAGSAAGLRRAARRVSSAGSAMLLDRSRDEPAGDHDGAARAPAASARRRWRRRSATTTTSSRPSTTASSGSRSASGPTCSTGLTKLYAALTGERPAFVDAEDASIELAARLEDKNCLIVIDDVWDPNDAKPFLRGGQRLRPPDHHTPPPGGHGVQVRAGCSWTR